MQDSGSRFPGFKDGKPSPLILGGLALAVIAGIILVVVALGSGGGDDNQTAVGDDDTQHAGLATSEPTPIGTLVLDRPTPTGVVENPTSVGAGDRVRIANANVDAPLTLRKVGLDGQMPDPEGSDDLAIYDFSAWPGKGGAPGKGGNTVLAGHVDSGRKACKNGTIPPPCQAVLWDLSKLKLGDEITINYGGQTFTYVVASNQPVSATNGPWDQIVSSTAQESITIITCGGDFNRATGEYSNRQVMTATRKV